MAIDDQSASFGEIRSDIRHLKEALETSEEKASRYRHSMREDVAEIKEGMVGMREQIKSMGPLVKDSAERWQRHDGASFMRKSLIIGAASVAGPIISVVGGYLYKLMPFMGKTPGP